METEGHILINCPKQLRGWLTVAYYGRNRQNSKVGNIRAQAEKVPLTIMGKY